VGNKEWVSKLNPKDIAKLLDALALVPNIINNDTSATNSCIKQEYFSVEKGSELPANVGLHGEMTFESIIQQFMSSDYKLVNTTKVGKCGDFVLKYSSSKTNKKYSLLIDVKNYKTTVPAKEIDKFNRDLKLNSGICGGLLLSLNSKIVGISKIIEFQEFSADHSIIPVVFVKSKQPEIICEIIKFIFHIIEIKDINRNEVLNKEELITTINELGDEIQLITSCRDNLQTSKMDLEKSLNQILFNLMQCEYNIAAKIKQINKSLVRDISVPLCINHEPQNTELLNLINTDLNNVILTFKNSIKPDYEVFLYSIYNIKWYKTVIDVPKKQWILYKENKLTSINQIYIYIKFNNKFIDVICPIQNEKFILEIKLDAEKNKFEKGKAKSDGYHITINPDNIELILQLCKLI
jgi:hypothetical protein